MSENEEYYNARREFGDRIEQEKENINGKRMGNRMKRLWQKEREWNWKEEKIENTHLNYQPFLNCSNFYRILTQLWNDIESQ